MPPPLLAPRQLFPPQQLTLVIFARTLRTFAALITEAIRLLGRVINHTSRLFLIQLELYPQTTTVYGQST
jgi:hypothetical protein